VSCPPFASESIAKAPPHHCAAAGLMPVLWRGLAWSATNKHKTTSNTTRAAKMRRPNRRPCPEPHPPGVHDDYLALHAVRHHVRDASQESRLAQPMEADPQQPPSPPLVASTGGAQLVFQHLRRPWDVPACSSRARQVVGWAKRKTAESMLVPPTNGVSRRQIRGAQHRKVAHGCSE
jgi:hypothetical protein